MFLQNPLAEAHSFRGEAETFNHLIKAALAVYFYSHGFHTPEDLCGTQRTRSRRIYLPKVLPLFSYAKISLLLKNLPLLYPWGLGLPRWGADLHASKCSPHRCVVIETMFDWKMWFKVVEFVTLGPWNDDIPHPRLLHWASQHQGEESNKGALSLLLPSPCLWSLGFPSQGSQLCRKEFFAKTCGFGKVGDCSQGGSTVTTEQWCCLAGRRCVPREPGHCRACMGRFGSPRRDSMGWILMTSNLLKIKFK